MSTVTWSTSPSASDIVDGDITAKVVCEDDRGNVVMTDGMYAVGLKIVTCRANDTALNEGTCRFNFVIGVKHLAISFHFKFLIDHSINSYKATSATGRHHLSFQSLLLHVTV